MRLCQKLTQPHFLYYREVLINQRSLTQPMKRIVLVDVSSMTNANGRFMMKSIFFEGIWSYPTDPITVTEAASAPFSSTSIPDT